MTCFASNVNKPPVVAVKKRRRLRQIRAYRKPSGRFDRRADRACPRGRRDNGLPRLLDMGQCNDAFSAIQTALALAEAFQCDVNELPLSLILSWYEQKAVCILLTLLHLGIQNIYLGPTLSAFLSPNVLDFLVKTYRIHPISTPAQDLQAILKS